MQLYLVFLRFITYEMSWYKMIIYSFSAHAEL